jgi:glycosyltransferase involved in cell wall biosynthesis
VAIDIIEAKDRGYLSERTQLRRVIEQHRIEVVHTHGYRCDVIDGSLAREMGRVHITTLHGFTARDWRGRLYEWVQVRAACRAHHAVAVAPHIERRLRSAGATRVSLIRNGLDTECPVQSRSAARAQLALPTSALVVGWVGRLSFEKGPDLFVDALRQLSGAGVGHVPLRAIVVGNGPLYAPLREVSKDLPIEFLGERSDARDLLPAFDVLALTSRTEGTPMVVLEAMAAGVPVIATAVGGVPDLISDGHGVLCEPTAISIADGLRRLSSQKILRDTVAERAAVRVREQFGLLQWIQHHLHIYASAIG